MSLTMDLDAVVQAKTRLVKAQKALQAFRSAETVEDAEEAWSDFLLAASTIYAKLEQGSKSDGASRGWFGRKKRERKDDPLLRYLHFARNSDEHGIERVAAVTTDNTWQGRSLNFNERIPVKVQLAEPGTDNWGAAVDAVVAGPTLKPVRANDRRFGDYCDPPKTHLGAEIQYSDFVDGLAAAALPYLKGLVAEAEELAARSLR